MSEQARRDAILCRLWGKIKDGVARNPVATSVSNQAGDRAQRVSRRESDAGVVCEPWSARVSAYSGAGQLDFHDPGRAHERDARGRAGAGRAVWRLESIDPVRSGGVSLSYGARSGRTLVGSQLARWEPHQRSLSAWPGSVTLPSFLARDSVFRAFCSPSLARA